MEEITGILIDIMKKAWDRNRGGYSFKELEEMAEVLEEPYCFWALKEMIDRLEKWQLIKHTIPTKDLWTIAKGGAYPYCDWAMSEIIDRQKNKQEY
jgi:hypothetical protein